jgi:osmotically-inducible protein OsmY
MAMPRISDPDAVLQDRKYYEISGVEFEREGTTSFIGKGPKDYDPDKRLWEEVCLNLTFSPDVDASQIEVLVHAGIVTLRGFATGRRMKKNAERCLHNIEGIRDINNELQIRRAPFFSEYDQYDTF